MHGKAVCCHQAERGSIIKLLHDLLIDSNMTIIADAMVVSEFTDRPDGVVFKLYLQVGTNSSQCSVSQCTQV